jgi:hypothetical protein
MPQSTVTRRRRKRGAVLPLIALASSLLVAVLLEGGAAARNASPPRLGEFMWGLAGQESGWNYLARNRSSGAFGKYQIMPFNWPNWSEQFLGRRWTDQTPYNQERVARAKLTNLYRWLGSWRRVAYWWLTGDTERNPRKWSTSASRYVRNVMYLMRRAPRGGVRPPRPSGGGASRIGRGDWRLVTTHIRLRPRVGSHRSAGRVREATVVRVVGTAWGPGRQVLWMRVETASGRIGWTNIKVTVPARRPDNARRWNDNDHRRGDRDAPSRDDRRRARPRPR